MYNQAYDGKTVLITGHTGFQGSWLTILLLRLGAKVVGYGLEPPTPRNLFTRAGLETHITHQNGDVRNMPLMAQTLIKHKPDYIFHLAAQSALADAYRDPVETFEINVMGSIALMEAVRQAKLDTTLIMVTTNTVYENQKWAYSYREIDQLGGQDPYSASKAALELAVSSFQQSFFNGKVAPARVASVRGGTVIGGGDWAAQRLVPDAIRALAAGKAILLRDPKAIYPWQHVLDLISGYVWLAALLARRRQFTGAWNLGPQEALPTRALVELLIHDWGEGTWEEEAQPADVLPYQQPLKLNTDKAASLLGWSTVWSLRQATRQTVKWYQADSQTDDPATVYDLCHQDIIDYLTAATAARLPFTRSAR